MGIPVDPGPGNPKGLSSLPQRNEFEIPGIYDSIWGWSSFIVVFCAMFGTTGIIFGGIACILHHTLWAAILLWTLAFFWFWYWCTR